MKRYLLNLCLIADQLVNTLAGGDPAETISSRVGKYARANEYPWLADFIDALFWKGHCAAAIEEDRGGDAVIPDAVKPNNQN